MHKVLVFTDTHITDDETIIGLNPSDRLRLGLEHALENHPDAAHLIITGDLTHNGTPSEYARLRSLIDSYPITTTLMLGNHDRRAPFLAQFPETETNGSFVQSYIELGDHRLIFLDTLDEDAPDRHSGLLCQTRLDWLKATLETDKTCSVFMHHPPFQTGFQGMDRIRLRNDLELQQTLRGRIAMLICGHVHRNISGLVNGIAFGILKSTCHQQPMTLNDPITSSSVDEPGAYGVMLLNDEQVTLMPEDFTLPANAIFNETTSETPK